MKEERFFYVPNASEKDCLPDDEFAHAVRVLRLGVDDQICLMDGKGTFYNAIITEVTKKLCRYHITSSSQQMKTCNVYLHIALAPTKNIDRIEWFVEKAVEIGVDEISLLNTDFTERKKINVERLKKIAVSAMKQSRKPYLTIINDMVDFKTFLNTVEQQNKFICHCYGDDNSVSLKKKHLFKDLITGLDDVLVMIGPEGDFSINEVLLSEKEGFIPVSLGESRLRTETAALVAVHIMNIFSSL